MPETSSVQMQMTNSGCCHCQTVTKAIFILLHFLNSLLEELKHCYVSHLTGGMLFI